MLILSVRVLSWVRVLTWAFAEQLFPRVNQVLVCSGWYFGTGADQAVFPLSG